MKPIDTPDIAIIGAGIAGLTLALSLHRAGISCRVYEAVDEIKPLGVGINLLPHAVKVLDALGLTAELARAAITTRESVFYNSHGQHIYSEPAGCHAGYPVPQFSIHRGDLQSILLAAVRSRLGADAVLEGHRCEGVEQDREGVSIHFKTQQDGLNIKPLVRAKLLIACDGIHSAIRKSLYPEEGAPRYSGVNMWRGTVPWKPFLSGASMVRAGVLSTGKMVIYPIRDAIDDAGHQLLNWVAEIETPQPARRDWSVLGRKEDFLPAFANWHFDWLDVPAMIEATTTVYEYPMVDQDPLPRWSFGKVTLLGDAAHPMVPRGSNGAGQAILDAPCLVEQLLQHGLGERALTEYEAIRRKATTEVVLMNRTAPPDAIIQTVHDLTGGKPFDHIDDVISQQKLAAISNAYKSVVGMAQPR